MEECTVSFPPLDVIENKFYFGIGGMGDFLLLMSTFYDDIEANTDVIFVCNNTKSIREMSKLFPMVETFWFFPRQAFFLSENMWERIVSHPLCSGTGVTPKKFNYVEDWIECGKTNVFDYYGVKENPMFAHPTNHLLVTKEDYIVIQPYGGSDDATKKKEMPKCEVENLVYKYGWNGITTYLIGSESDKTTMGELQNLKGYETYKWITDIEEAFTAIRGCSEFYGADSWGKTVACFAGHKTWVYENEYINTTPMEIFNHPVDPGNYVFLIGWDLLYKGDI